MRKSRKSIMAGLPVTRSEIDWVIPGSLITGDKTRGVIKLNKGKRYYYDYHAEYDVFVRLYCVNTKKADQEVLDKAHTLGMTRSEYEHRNDDKKLMIEKYQTIVSELWDISVHGGYYPYTIKTNWEYGVKEDKYGNWTSEGSKWGTLREWKHIDQSFFHFNGWLNGDRKTLRTSVIADMFYAKMRFMITGEFPKVGVHLTVASNTKKIVMSKKVEQLILRIFDELTIELFVDWLKNEAVGEACCVSRREEMARYSVVKIKELKEVL